MNNKVLIFSYLPRHLKKMVPVIHSLSQDRSIELTVLVMSREEQEIALQEGFSCTLLQQYTSKTPRWNFDLGWGLEPLIKALDDVQPDLFIALEVNYILRNAIRYCKQNNIRNLILQHGTPNEFSLHAFTPFEGECFAAWGEYTKDFLLKHGGITGSQIVLTGGVPFDKTISLSPDKKEVARSLGVPVNKKWIVFTTQSSGAHGRPTPSEIEMSILEVVELSSHYSDVHFIFQVHPSQPIEEVSDIVSKSNNANYCTVARYKDTEGLMKLSDGVITFFSTTALDAVIMQKPLMLINLHDDHEFLPFASMRAAYGVSSREEIAFALDNMIHQPNALIDGARRAAEYVNYMNGDGKAIERVMQLIHNILQNNYNTKEKDYEH
ncbi:CDP-glycerol glycerophosphotransferase family protein [Paenibacillus vini]|uniref:CDP-glycerol glycerophosphotransferase family protein n=1 Tax=Paenibacillus vini TaxID=1476024 RepID=UPI0025B65BAD|nr:CDP-glycerol glycerophosphotransferase family protein [Paenibacillus vini]MDN4066445.1 CDP-glycerol glycerophosphotransferase family protein [Paenibacillus vini]